MNLSKQEISIIISSLALMQEKYMNCDFGYYNGSFQTKIPCNEIYDICIELKKKIIDISKEYK